LTCISPQDFVFQHDTDLDFLNRPSPAPLPFTEDIDEDACTDPLEWGTPEEYQDLDGFDETEDFYLPSNLLVGVELLAVNKQINDEASTVLYQNRRFRFNSHQLTRLLTNRNLFDQLCHIQLEDFAHNRFLNLVPIVKALLGGQRVKDITIGKNTANLFLHWTSQSLGKCESGWKAQGQVSDFEGYYDATIRLRVGALPKLSFYNFTKLREWNKVDGYFHKYAGYASRPEVVVELEEGMCHQLGAGLIDKTR